MKRGTGRRGHGEGCVYQRPDGRWAAYITLPRGTDGRRRRKFFYAATQAAAATLLRRHGGRATEGQLTTTSTPTVRVLLEQWLAVGLTAKGEPWRPSTRRSYHHNVHHFLIPAFGTLRLEQLTGLTIQAWLTQHQQDFGARRRIGLAHAVLRSALTYADTLGLITVNAAKRVRFQKAIARPITPFTIEQARTFLTVASSHRLGALFSVALGCGLRLGEATGLRIEDVDLATGVVTIQTQLQLVKVPGQRKQQLVLQDPKTEKSRRTLVLPAVCLEAVRSHRIRQLEERLKTGPRWHETGLLFTTFSARGRDQCGGGLHPRNVLRTLHGLLKAAGLPRCRFHDLRHSCASILIAQGVQLAEISQLLGHSQLRLTADTYGHLQQQTASRAAQHLDRVLGKG